MIIEERLDVYIKLKDLIHTGKYNSFCHALNEKYKNVRICDLTELFALRPKPSRAFWFTPIHDDMEDINNWRESIHTKNPIEDRLVLLEQAIQITRIKLLNNGDISN